MTDTRRLDAIKEILDADSRIIVHRELARVHNALATALENGTHAAMTHKRGWVSVEDVAGLLDLTRQAANNRLSTLCERGICERRFVSVPTGGRSFEYRWVYDWNDA